MCNLIGCVLLYLRGRQGSEYLTYWAISFFIVGFQHAFAIVVSLQSPHLIYGGLLNLTTLVAGGFVLVGTYSFLNRRAPKIWFLPATIIAVWTIASPFWGVSFLAATAPAFWFRGTTDMFAGIIMLRQRREGAGPKIAGLALLLWGFHQLNYPVLRPVEWFAPWGFALGMVLGFTVGVGLLMAHYEIARRELAASEDEFRSLFENSVDGIFLADENGKFLKVNPALERILGYDSGVMLGLTVQDLEATHGPLADDTGTSEDVDQIWKRTDGRQIHVIIRTRSTQSGNTTAVMGSVRDVTHTQMLQEQLNLERRMDALGRLAGGIAHDFNNILTAVLGSVDLVELEIEAKQSPTATLEVLRMSTLKAAELSSQLLAFTRQRSGDSGPIRLGDALDNTEAMLHRLLPDTVSLQVKDNTPMAYCSAEPGQLERVILNLAVNAQDAMPRGGVLEIETSMADPSTVLLTVRDSGVGIDAQILHQIFEPFFSTKGGDGTGLGLANVFMLVESMGGAIEVDSAIGRGSTFTVKLPLSASPALAPADATKSETKDRKTLQGPRLLLVEDRELVRNSIQAILQHAGYQVTTAVNGEEALKVMARSGHEIDVVLTDVLMPIMSGPALIDQLLVLRPDLNFLMMSGHPEDELEHFGLLDRHFLAKPFSASALLDKLEKVIGT